MAEPRILGIVLAGGEGKRLAPLTADRAKPAVPFAGLYRLIDFALSNLVNASVLEIAVLTQYKSHSLDRHITMTWRLSNLLGNYVTPVPAQQRLGPRWYTGSADAIFQSLNLINDERPDLVVVFGADHVYRMDPRQMWQQHLDGGAGRHRGRHPRAAQRGHRVRRDPDRARRPRDRGVPGEAGRPARAARPPGRDVTRRWATTSSAPRRCSTRCTPTPPTRDSKHDMGGNIVPMLIGQSAAQVYDFQSNEVPGEDGRQASATGATSGRSTPTSTPTWTSATTSRRSTSTTSRWPILTHIPSHPPAKFVHDDGDRVGQGDRQHRVERRDRLRRVGDASRCSPRACTCTAGRRSSARC